MSLRKILLNLFLASIAVNAVLGIWALLVDDFGETQGKVLASSFLISAAMLSALVNAPAIGRQVLGPAPLVGAIAGAGGFTLFIVLLWAEPDGQFWFKLAGSLLVVAGGATLAAALAMIGLPQRLAPVSVAADAFIAVLAATILVAIWAEIDEDWLARLIGIEAVLVAALTLAIPVLARFGTGQDVVPGPAIRFCPSCGESVTERGFGVGAASACPTCGLRFDVVAGRANGAPGDSRQRRSGATLGPMSGRSRP